jgi:SAM-dependent methyltransferase
LQKTQPATELRTPDRTLLERIILPALGERAAGGRVLFVGCDSYTSSYGQFFPRADYRTVDADPAHAVFGSPQHVVCSVTELRAHFAANSLDLVLLNGVLGWGIDDRAAANEACAACRDVLRSGGLFLVGWNDPRRITSRVRISAVENTLRKYEAVRPDHLDILAKMTHFLFEPLGAWRVEITYATQLHPILSRSAYDSWSHTFDFYQKSEPT